MDYTIENFIEFCDDMQIAEESIGNIGRTLKARIEKAILTLRHMIKRLLYNAYKLKKWYIPKEVYISINNLNMEVDNKFRKIDELFVSGYATECISDIKDSNDWKLLTINSKIKSYSESDYTEINTYEIITTLKSYDKTLEYWEKWDIDDRKNGESSYYLDNMIKLYSFRLNIISQYFKWGKQKNKDGQIIDLGESITVEINPSNLF